ncbi:2-amino-4-hydroxy-6-hydroxymethyldihydropteridine diphosphokinase [Geomonas subterranea]|uniref:2-amino-4-hydroxy-6-hydroxymethyldihydropteridine pyrophosphokinase n=1 Tax=Geomonas subterranea TaxID=2847989 RepID=A0ABX8LDA5_9BACT|nr:MULTISPECIES: 2-amino-4-hydroxy-6-hydroxymethyldihydropteridine diphosphokinase [Geomonas]QXE89404.1 2-amino-4-hydroxy-6-hydroxymethyldihydropteridine diphosphokinase [Geomonas subterranea]QXM08480.1 2-amino-4-hydroxy-6-hydroxymethyldihydropteridine diphosphokinase [Geomonas subterranea]
MEQCAYIGLGSNIGDRELKLLMAIAELGKLPQTRVTAVSPFYETEPVGGVPQDNFYNAVVRLNTEMAPLELLDRLKRLETEVFRRVPSERWGARSMDLDILLYGELVSDSEELTIPHPRLAERRFALQPLSDIAPDLVHPILGKRIIELLTELTSPGKVVRI